MHFLAGLPRSGTSAIAAVLNQHLDIHCSLGSALPSVLRTARERYQDSEHTKAARVPGQVNGLVRGIMSGFYDYVGTQHVFDKNRWWSDPVNMAMVHEATGRRPRVICPVRPLPEILASWVTILQANPGNTLERSARSRGYDWTTEGICAYLTGPDGNVGDSIKHIRAAVKSSYFDCLLFVHYSNFLKAPQHQLNRIHDFIGLDRFKYDFTNITHPAVEDDATVYGLPGLHDVTPYVPSGREPGHAKAVLGGRLFDYYEGFTVT